MSLTQFPRAGVSKSGSTTNNHIAVWDGTDTSTIKDGGVNGGGTVTSVSVVSANGYSGTVATSTTTPAITIVPLGIAQNSKSADYTTVLADNCGEIYHPVGDNNARTFTIAANGSVAYPIGAAITFTNMAVADVSVILTTDTLFYVDTGTVTTITVPQFNTCTALKKTSTSWLVSGSSGCTAV